MGFLSCRHVCFSQAPQSDFLFQDLNLDLNTEQITVLFGESGSGKTTLGLLLAGALTPKSGDVLYDGPLIDDFYHSVVDAYVASMRRLRALPVRVVHAGHFGSFGRDKMLELIDDYILGRRVPGCPGDHA